MSPTRSAQADNHSLELSLDTEKHALGGVLFGLALHERRTTTHRNPSVCRVVVREVGKAGKPLTFRVSAAAVKLLGREEYREESVVVLLWIIAKIRVVKGSLWGLRKESLIVSCWIY